MIEKKIYKMAIIAGMILPIISILGNIFADFPLIINLKWFAIELISIMAYFFNRNEKYVEISKFIFFLVIIVIIVPFGYIDSGGSNNNSIGYIFVLLICVVYLFKGKQRYFFSILLCGIFIIMQLVEYHFPQIMRVYSTESQFRDRMVQIPLLLFFSFLMIRHFSAHYEENKDKLEKANRKLSYLANFDALTGLGNRHYFDMKIANVAKTHDKNHTYLAFFDIDKFKDINDTLGHSVGDEMLSGFSKAIDELIEYPHLLARWGGDEFAFLYVGEEEDLKALLENFRQCYAELADQYGIKTNISIGVVKWGNSDYQHLFARADKALYEAKENQSEKIVFDH